MSALGIVLKSMTSLLNQFSADSSEVGSFHLLPVYVYPFVLAAHVLQQLPSASFQQEPEKPLSNH